MTVRVWELVPGVQVAERPLPGFGGEVRAALVTGARRRVLVDTLLSPRDVAGLATPDLVVNSHADWDHVWGNPAFAGRVPIIGHRRCRERLLRDDGGQLQEFLARDPDTYAGAGIVPPDMTFDGTLLVDAGGLTLELHPLPGHTEDTLVVYIPERKLLLATDGVELPVPTLAVPALAATYAARLRAWAERGVELVAPSHGPMGGPDVIHRCADYVDGLFQRVRQARASGVAPVALAAALPLRQFVAGAGPYDPYYETAHAQNLQVVLAALAD